MKPKSDIIRRVMKRVVGTEKKNVFQTLIILFGIFASLCVSFVFVTLLFVRDVRELGTWDVLTLFWEDREIIADFWADVLSTFWLEVPTEYLFILLGILAIAWIIFYSTRERRKNLRERSQKLASYEKSGTMVNGGKKK